MIDPDFETWLDDFKDKIAFVEDTIQLSVQDVHSVDLSLAADGTDRMQRLHDLEDKLDVLERSLGLRQKLRAELDAKHAEVWSALQKAQSTLTSGKEPDDGTD